MATYRDSGYRPGANDSRLSGLLGGFWVCIMTSASLSFCANTQQERFCTEYSHVSSHLVFIQITLRNIAKFPETCVFAFCFKEYLFLARCDICQTSLLWKIISLLVTSLISPPESQAQRFVYGSCVKEWLKGTFHSFLKDQKSYFLSRSNSSSSLSACLSPSQISLKYHRSEQSLKPQPLRQKLHNTSLKIRTRNKDVSFFSRHCIWSSELSQRQGIFSACF